MIRHMSISLNKKSFTLIEVIIVMVIIGILAVMLVPILQVTAIKSRLKEVDTTIIAINTQINIYRARGYAISAIDELIKRDLMNEGYGFESGMGYVTTDLFKFKIFGDMIHGPLYVWVEVKQFGNIQLCSATYYPDGSCEWFINDSHPWAQYLNIPNAKHKSW